MRRLLVVAVLALALAGCQYSVDSTTHQITGIFGDQQAGNNAAAPSGSTMSNVASTQTCGESGSLTDRQCWQEHTGALGWATDWGTAWTQPTTPLANLDAQDPTTDPNLKTFCMTPGTVIDLYATTATATGGTCTGVAAPTNGQLKDTLLYGCVNVHNSGATLNDDYIIDPYPTCHTGGDGGAGVAGISTGSTFGSGRLTSAVEIHYVTVDGQGCHSNSGAPNLCGEYIQGVGGLDYTCRNCYVFGYAHDWYVDGNGDVTHPSTATSSDVTIIDSMAPMTLGYTDVVAGVTACSGGLSTGVHQEPIFAWNTDDLTITHDWLAIDEGTTADPADSTACADAAIVLNNSAINFDIDNTYLQGNQGFNIKGSCASQPPPVIPGDAYTVLDYNHFSPDAQGYSSYGYPGTILAWSPTGTSNVWGAHNQSADGSVNPIPSSFGTDC